MLRKARDPAELGGSASFKREPYQEARQLWGATGNVIGCGVSVSLAGYVRNILRSHQRFQPNSMLHLVWMERLGNGGIT